ncbi:hypothetical protein HIM_11949 [Hirsutella minnesotensis 3608]|uniref:Restless-like transposase n=1 Tax=Hirsutella minnesotensis 3608 TaxID=1043627 RepID=A0A0F8A0M9_9HYPO|nr:hypothetical protein HIM_11949 [Hirsutella minnesotensis 3608]
MKPTALATSGHADTCSKAVLEESRLHMPAIGSGPDTLSHEAEHRYLWRCFPDHVWSQRVRETSSWVWDDWDHGYDIQKPDGSRRWVCKRCIRSKNPRPKSFAEKGIQNANAHLFRDHRICAPANKTQSAAEKKAEKLRNSSQKSIADVMKLDVTIPREQEIANNLVKGFDRNHFQRLLLEWIVEENHSFSVCEQKRLRHIFEYLNPLVKITDANISSTAIRQRVISAYEKHKSKVVEVLKRADGLVHISFDGWRSANRHSLYGLCCFFRDENSHPRKLVLGVPELQIRHRGENIAAKILDILDTYQIREKAFEDQLDGEHALSETEHDLWRRKGPVGKLHNLVVAVRRSDQLTYLLRSIQRCDFDTSPDSQFRSRNTLDLVADNDTRWLSQLYMIRRALKLRPYIEQLIFKHQQQWEQDNRSKITGRLRGSARMPQICLEENQLSAKDWEVLEHLAKLLGFYEDAVKTLEGDGQARKRKHGWTGSYGNVWEIIQGFEFLLEVLEDYKQLAAELPDAEHLWININLGWEKLNKYYSRLDETPIYYASLALHPAFRWGYFENEWKGNPDWINKAKRIVRETWEREYRDLPIAMDSSADAPLPKRPRKYHNPFQAYCERTRPASTSKTLKREAPTAALDRTMDEATLASELALNPPGQGTYQ